MKQAFSLKRAFSLKQVCLSAYAAFFIIVFSVSAAFAASGEGDSVVKGLWIEIPDLPETVGASFTARSGGDGEAWYERATADGLLVSVERIYSEDNHGEMIMPADTAKLVARLEELRGGRRVDPDDVEMRESVEEFAEIYTYPASSAVYSTGENEDMKKNIDVFIFTDEWVFRVHASIPADAADDYEEKVMDWFGNMNFVERGESES